MLSESRLVKLRRTARAALLVAGALAFSASHVRAQEPFASFDFEDGSLGDFVLPVGVDICGEVAPAGTGDVKNGELVVETDDIFGIGLIGLIPDVVDELFPDSRDYRARARVTLDTATQMSIAVRSRIGIIEELEALDSSIERGYTASIVAQGAFPEVPDGFLAVAEFTACHEFTDHPEWPGGATTGYAVVPLEFPILQGEEYWLEVAVVGDDETGPVTITAALWPEGAEPPARPQIVVVDPDGLAHTPETLDPDAELQVLMAVNLDIEPRPLGATAIFDDLTLTEVVGCTDAPATVTRALWEPTIPVEGTLAGLYSGGEAYDVRLEIAEPRAEGLCPAAADVVLTESVPAGWTVADISDGGTFGAGSITWNIDVSTVSSVSYRATASGSGRAVFAGEVADAGDGLVFVTGGPSVVVDASAVPAVSDFGSIQRWLILGPFGREVGGADPGQAEIVKDYLTDGDVTEATVNPRAGDTIEPDYSGAAASTELLANTLGRNPDGVPMWVEWQDLDDADDRIDFERVYGEMDDVMEYAVTYLEVEEQVQVNFGVSSDDSVHVLLDGATLHANSASRGALERAYQDLPGEFAGLGGVVLTPGIHTLMVKVFDGGGEHNFRIGFVDELGVEIPGGPDGVTVLLAPETSGEPLLRRGDADASGDLNITDGIFALNFLFSGGASPSCPDAADVNDDNSINIADPVYLLNFLFGGGPPPLAPGPEDCGPDPSADELGVCVFPAC